MSGHTPGPWSYCGADRGGCSCLTITAPDHPIAEVTGGAWGDRYPSIRLTGNSLERQAEAYMEQITYGEVPMEVAKANAALIAAAPDMLAALLNVQKIIAEGAMTGFNCHDGDWAERLFESQQMTSRAIKAARHDASAGAKLGGKI